MAITLTDSRATVTAGRGRNKLVVLDVSFAELEKWARKVQIDEARLWRRSYGRAVSGLRAKFRKVITNAGGAEGVPKFRNFEAFTRELRTARNKTAPMGGTLAEKEHIVGFKRNGWQIIGWPDSLAEWAVKFQDAIGNETQLNDPGWRYGVHRSGVKDIPRNYAHNPRRVIPQPFGDYVDKYLDEWARGAFYKELARLMAKEAS